MKKVAVIGAGAAGLVMIKHLISVPEVFKVMAFERAGEVGGLWVYTEKTGIAEDGLPVHSSVYKNLRTNTPKLLQKYLDFPYKSPQPSYMGQGDVLEYLQSYAEENNLRRYIKFNTLVTKVNPLTPESVNTRWEVTYCSTGDQTNSTIIDFDYVIVCNGPHNCPYIPDIAGLETFSGTVIHAHDYRVPEKFKGQTVVCYGGGPSAMDIAIDLHGVAGKIIIAIDDLHPSKFVSPEGVLRKPGIDHVTGTSLTFTNGDEEHTDVILLCTGYKYNFPFLTDACMVTLADEGRRITNLYKHMFHIDHPTLLFHGVVYYTAAFNLLDIMARFAVKILNGSTQLPAKEEMAKDTAECLDMMSNTSRPTRKFHKLGTTQNELADSLAAMAGTPTLTGGERALFARNMELIQSDTLRYRDINYELTEDGFKVV